MFGVRSPEKITVVIYKCTNHAKKRAITMMQVISTVIIFVSDTLADSFIDFLLGFIAIYFSCE